MGLPPHPGQGKAQPPPTPTPKPALSRGWQPGVGTPGGGGGCGDPRGRGTHRPSGSRGSGPGAGGRWGPRFRGAEPPPPPAGISGGRGAGARERHPAQPRLGPGSRPGLVTAGGDDGDGPGGDGRAGRHRTRVTGGGGGEGGSEGAALGELRGSGVSRGCRAESPPRYPHHSGCGAAAAPSPPWVSFPRPPHRGVPKIGGASRVPRHWGDPRTEVRG